MKLSSLQLGLGDSPYALISKAESEGGVRCRSCPSDARSLFFL